MLWQAWGNTLFGYAAWALLLARHPAATISPVALLVLVFGMGTEAAMLSEPLLVCKLAAALLVMTGLLSTSCGGDGRHGCSARCPRGSARVAIAALASTLQARGSTQGHLMRVNRWICAALLAGLCSGPAMAWQAAQVTRYDATDFPGNDIGDMVGRARSFDDCAQRCIADGRCGAFTFNLNDANCVPKSSGESPQRNARAVSGIVSRAAPGYGGGNVRGVTRYDETDFPGQDIDGMAGGARSYEDCAQRCIADGRCGAFTFNLNNGNCIPKSGTGSQERNDRAVSGVLERGAGGVYRPGPQLPVTRYDATDLPQGDIDDMVGAAGSYEDCAGRCLADGRCAAFTFNLNNGTCIPKAVVGAPQRNDRAVSGIVKRGPDQPYPGPGGSSSCNVHGTQRCPGCSSSCGPSQRPVCSAPIEGPGGACLREAECRCVSN